MAPNGSFHHKDRASLIEARFPGLTAVPSISDGAVEPRNVWDSPVEDDDVASGGGAIINAGGSTSPGGNGLWSLLPLEEFMPVLVPHRDSAAMASGQPNSPQTTTNPNVVLEESLPKWRRVPEPYSSVRATRQAKAKSLQDRIEASGATQEQIEDLQVYVQNEFMEWLHAEGHSIEMHNWIKYLKKRR